MVNYNNSIIYKLCCKDPEIKEIYIGSTTNFYRRKQNHKSKCNNSNNKSYNLNVYKFIRENGNWENWQMVEVERYKAIDKQDLHKQERYILEKLGASLNRNIPSRTIKEYYQENQDKFKEYYQENQDKYKEYYQENKEKNKEYQKKYGSEKVVCNVCNKKFRRDGLNKHKKNIHNI